jgi:hypothetical protein
LEHTQKFACSGPYHHEIHQRRSFSHQCGAIRGWETANAVVSGLPLFAARVDGKRKAHKRVAACGLLDYNDHDRGIKNQFL